VLMALVNHFLHLVTLKRSIGVGLPSDTPKAYECFMQEIHRTKTL
jgi:hypothetical protein